MEEKSSPSVHSGSLAPKAQTAVWLHGAAVAFQECSHLQVVSAAHPISLPLVKSSTKSGSTKNPNTAWPKQQIVSL